MPESVLDQLSQVETEALRGRYLPGEQRQVPLAERLPARQGEENVVDVAGDIEDEQFLERLLVGARHRVVERVGSGAPDIADHDAVRPDGPARDLQEFPRRQMFRNVAGAE